MIVAILAFLICNSRVVLPRTFLMVRLLSCKLFMRRVYKIGQWIDTTYFTILTYLLAGFDPATSRPRTILLNHFGCGRHRGPVTHSQQEEECELEMPKTQKIGQKYLSLKV